MKIALALIAPLITALACAPPLQPAAQPTPTTQPGSVIQIPPEHAVPLTLTTPRALTPTPQPTQKPPPTQSPVQSPTQPAIIAATAAPADSDDKSEEPDASAPTPTPDTPNPDNEPDVSPTDKPVPSLPMRPFKRNPPIGALGSYLSDMARDAEKPGADLLAIADAAPISKGESVAITLLGALTPSQYETLRDALLDIGADIRNESRLADATAIEMYIPVTSLRALSSLHPGIHRIEPIIPPQPDISQSPQLPMQPAQTAIPTIENGKTQVDINDFLGIYGNLAYVCPDGIAPGEPVPGTEAHLPNGARGDPQWRRAENGCERTGAQ